MSTGIQNTTGVGSTQNLVALSFAQAITRLMPNGTAPLFGLTSMLPSETALQTEHGFFTKTMLFPQLTLSASITASDVVLPVVSTANVLPGMIMRVQSSGEQLVINAIMSPISVQVTRGLGTATAIAASGVNLYQTGNAFEESSLRPNAMQINPVRITNLTQIFRNTWALSGSAQATQVIAGESTVAENRQDCAGFHAADIEKALFFSYKSQSVRNGQPFRTMDGFLSIVSNLAYYPAGTASANVYTAGSTTTYSQLKAMLDPVFNQVTDPAAGNSRLLFCGGAAFNVLNDIGRLNSSYQMMNGSTSYGLQFSEFKIPRGNFRMVEHPLFNTNPDWSKLATALDLSSFRVAYLGGRKTKKEEFNVSGDKVVDNGIDAVGGSLLTEMTCVIKNPPANAVIWNLTAGAVG